MEWIKVRTDINNIEKVVQHGISLGYVDSCKILEREEYNLFFNPLCKMILWSDNHVFNTDENYITMTPEEFNEYRGEDLT